MGAAGHGPGQATNVEIGRDRVVGYLSPYRVRGLVHHVGARSSLFVPGGPGRSGKEKAFGFEGQLATGVETAAPWPVIAEMWSAHIWLSAPDRWFKVKCPQCTRDIAERFRIFERPQKPLAMTEEQRTLAKKPPSWPECKSAWPPATSVLVLRELLHVS